jgi:hypothetical protein
VTAGSTLLRRLPLSGALVLASVLLGACANTLQDQPIASSTLEKLVLERGFPVYWLGGTFEGLAITNVDRDPSGAFTIHYGDCTEGGQNTCVTPLTVVTSPDNSFHPGEQTPRQIASIRGVPSVVAQQGNTIEIPTGGVLVDIYANSPRLARGAAQAATPINQFAVPGARFPGAQPDNGYSQRPALGQMPPAGSTPQQAQ